MKLKELLEPGCDHFQRKLEIFSTSEGWVDHNLETKEQQLLHSSFARVKSLYQKPYYHTLYHLLTCAFCIDRDYHILGKRSHKELWRLAEQHPGDYIHILNSFKKSPQINPQASYFLLLYNKLVLCQTRPIMFCWRHGTNIAKEVSSRKAAGNTDHVPPNMPVPEKFIAGANLALNFQWDPISGELNMGLIGGSAKTRLAVKLQVFYSDGDMEEFIGKHIAIGGMWSIAAEKAKNICRIDFIYQNEE